jgi:hypothetical protein
MPAVVLMKGWSEDAVDVVVMVVMKTEHVPPCRFGRLNSERIVR